MHTDKILRLKVRSKRIEVRDRLRLPDRFCNLKVLANSESDGFFWGGKIHRKVAVLGRSNWRTAGGFSPLLCYRCNTASLSRTGVSGTVQNVCQEWNQGWRANFKNVPAAGIDIASVAREPGS